MRWYHYLAYFFGDAFLANTLPHLLSGVSGNAFQSPFASPVARSHVRAAPWRILKALVEPHAPSLQRWRR
jgi:hypothetical protein